jgi:4-amino-4-deoxy-L-arabinose transferase-like glycosyltransferase
MNDAADRATLSDARAAMILTVGLTLARLIALFRTPLQLYPDEAQYWLWSRTLDFGYYSKPPVIAWSIWLTTRMGDAESWVRLSAPLYQAGATVMVFLIGRRLYSPAAGLLAAALYGLMPGVQLSALVAATDAPLLFFLGLSVLAYVELLAAGAAAGSPARRLWLAAGLGAALGVAFLSKYAAVYLVIGLVLHALVSRDARRAWSPARLGVMGLALAAALAPNLAWNAAHGFATFQHTASNAAWGGRQLFNPGELGWFVLTQFGVFGPIPFGVLIAGLGLAAARRRLSGPDLTLACFTLPPLVIVMAQAFVSRANANWSGAGYLTGAVLVAAWLMRWRARAWIWAALGSQAVLAAVFLVLVISPHLADRAGLGNAFKRARGWSETTDMVLTRAAGEPGLTAIAVNNRFLFYALAYYGRNDVRPPLTAWLLMDGPRNQAETTAPLTPELGRRVLAVSYEGVYLAEMQADFARTSGLEIGAVRLDPKHRRSIRMFVGEGFNPRPRDPVSGRPTPP